MGSEVAVKNRVGPAYLLAMSSSVSLGSTGFSSLVPSGFQKLAVRHASRRVIRIGTAMYRGE
jgi:hypothetical protein